MKIEFLSVIIPAYNESRRIGVTLDCVHEFLKDKKYEHEVIVADDGSTDNTVALVDSYAKRMPKLRVVKNGVNKGKGYAVKNGMNHAKGDFCLFMDADNSVDISHIDRFEKEVERGSDVIIGSIRLQGAKATEHNGLHRKILSILSKTLIGLFVPYIRDTQRGFKLFSRKAANIIFPRQTINRFGFDIELLCIAYDTKLTIKELPVIWDNPAGSTVRLKSYFDTLIELARIIKNRALGLYLPEKQGSYMVINVIKNTYRWAAGFINGPDHDPELNHICDNQGKKCGFTHCGNEFLHHSNLHHFESAFYNIIRHQKFQAGLILAIMAVAFFVNWHATLIFLFGAVTIVYFIDLLFNAYVIYRSLKVKPELVVSKVELANLRDEDLPVYTIFCPLYKEWQVVPQFAAAMSKLDYPKDKLQIMFLLEENDKETVEKVREANLPPHFEIVVVPHSKPKTKPKAMNYGLKHVRGEILVIYDAEDVPDTDQLKKAVVAFKKVPQDVVCIQAKLNFYNPNQNVLTRVFTAEYSLWFDLVLPGLQSIGAPIPLGGTSNHFRVPILRQLSGWDAFNVTEDCDLGMRLAKRGYRTAIVESTTYEEANSHFFNWVSQRSRWIKGYIQTYLVHMRRPSQFSRSGKLKDLFMLQLIVGGKVISLFINPVMWVTTIVYFAFREQTAPFIETLFPGPILYIGVFSLVCGNFLYLYYYMIGCARRGHNGIIKYVFLVPFYWLSMSLASWRSVYEVIVKPHYWAKTKHGLHLNKDTKSSQRLSTQPT